MSSTDAKHFVLVHGLCHGAWCWYKVVARLAAAGHRVTALDMAASGVHPARLDEVPSFEEHSRPLLDAVAASPDSERLVLVGHSHGGLSLALAMERFPRKITAAVFVAAALPCVGKHMGNTKEEPNPGGKFISAWFHRSIDLYHHEQFVAMESGKKQHHFVLVHGVCHGAWCWYKVATILESAGHRVTALDMAACGASAVRVEEVRSFEEYSRQLLDAVVAAPPDEKVVLVGHSFGGHNLALAMERHPEKVAVAVFVAAAVSFVGRPMSLFLEQLLKEHFTPDTFMGTSFGIVERDSEDPVETFLLGPEWMSQKMYQLSPPEDLRLATMLVRPSQLFLKDGTMTGDSVLTEGGYGSVSRVLVVTEEDTTWPAEDQRRVAASCGAGVEVRAIEGADHMPMFSKPAELTQLVMDVAEKYA